MSRLVIGLCILCACSTGCAVHELHGDEDRIRSTLLDLYTNQIMDNLVRASNGLPIIQLDYTNANANVTMEQTASLSDAAAVTNSNVLTTAATKTLQVTHQTVNTLIGGLGATHQNQVAITANPSLSSKELYDAYLTFLGLSGSLQVTDCPPPPGAAHIWQKYNKQYYWVPEQFKDAFFNLAMVTTAQRDRLIEIPDMYSVTLRSLDAASVETRFDSFTIDVDIDAEKTIPNESGDVYTLDGQLLATLSVYQPFLVDPTTKQYRKDKDGKHFETDGTINYYSTNRLRITFNPASEKASAMKISLEELKAKVPLAVRIRLETTPPPAPTTKELLDRISFRVPQAQSK